MASQIIPDERIKRLNDLDVQAGDYTLFWMQQSQRAECNHALEFAIQRANQSSKRLLVCFGLDDSYPDANLRHFHFMLEGLKDIESKLLRRKIRLIVRRGNPANVTIKLAQRATEVICDRGYLRHQTKWRDRLAEDCNCPVWQVESDAIVPVESASKKREYAARTIRSKLQGQYRDFLTDLATTSIDKDSRNLGIDGMDLKSIGKVLHEASIDRTVTPLSGFQGGTSQAKQRLKDFIHNSLSQYEQRSSILDANVSRLSPYLHFGQISPLTVAQEIESSRGHSTEQKQAFLEELLVRRELAINFVHYETNYDSLKCLPEWAAQTLAEHEEDEREHRYTAQELENAETHDPAWNAAMLEMKHSGYLHNHLRMYWGKKIIQWTNTSNHAYRVALHLNNKYFLDGRDANSYANVLWLFGLHDRAHQEREIFGKVRYMSANGLKRKFDVDQYVSTVQARCDTRIKGFDHEPE